MTTNLTAESFLSLVKQSGLVDPDQLKKVCKEIAEQGGNTEDAQVLAGEMVSRNTITRWQADKLLQGKHKGFFLGKYRLLSHLGTGGMSSVYLAEHVLMRRRVALKVLPQQRVDDSSYLQRFHREAQAVAALDHRNIVRAYDVDQEGKTHFLVMEYVGGQSLQDMVMKSGPLDFVSAAEYLRQAAEGLSAAHRAGMVHRDIKPGNVLVDEKGTVKLLDLGLARFFDDKEENSLTIQHDEKVLGTADYLAPEQALDSHTVDVRADIYSLGCTLYFLLTGHPPYPDGTMAQRLMAHQTKQPKPIVEERADMPAGLTDIINKMMAKNPDERYQTARDTAQALHEWLTLHGGASWARMNAATGQSSIMTGSGISVSPGASAASGSSVLGTASPALAAAPTAVTPMSTAVAVAPAAVAEEQVNFASLFGNFGADDAKPQATAVASVAVAAPAAVAVPVAQAAVLPGQTAVPVAQAVPVAVPVAQPVAASAGKGKKPAKSSGKPMLLAVAGGVTALAIVAVVYFTFGSKGDSKATAAKKNATPKSTGGKKETSGGSTASGPAGPMKRELTVGPSGEFKTIAAALAQAKQNPMAKSRNAVQIIKVAAGQYTDRIILDGTYPRGIQIESTGGEAVLAPSGSEPIVQIKDKVEAFRLEGFRLDASGKETAVRMTGWMQGAKLKRLKITGFSKAGIVGEGLSTYSAEADKIVVEQVEFSGDPQAVGVNLKKGTDDPNHIRLKQCRFLGPLAQGVQCENQVLDLEIVESIFYRTKTGVRLEGADRQWRDVVFSNNTFYDTEHAIVFTNMPVSGSAGFAFYNNLFVQTKGAAVVVEKDLDELKFSSMYSTQGSGVLNNWTDAPAKPAGNELKLFAVDSGGNQYGVKGLSFVSTDPTNSDFLAPPAGSPLRTPTKASVKKYGGWVGAVQPKS